MADANTLAAAIEAEMSTYSVGSGQDEPHITVNDDRSITVPDELKYIGVQYDNNIETVTIDCPRYWDGHDLSQMYLMVNFVHYEPNKSGGYSVDTARAELAETNETRMLLNWTINASAMRYDGILAWLVCAKSLDAAGHEDLHWNSQICYDMQVHKGLEYNDESVENHDFVAEALEQILAATTAVESSLVTIGRATEAAAASAKVAKEAQTKIEHLENIAADIDAAAKQQQAVVNDSVQACRDAVTNVQLVTAPFYIVDTDNNTTYHAAIQVRDGKPVIVYDELT